MQLHARADRRTLGLLTVSAIHAFISLGCSSGSDDATDATDATDASGDTNSGIESMFGPPVHAASADSIFGVWATANDSPFETRMRITASSVTLARKCNDDDRIAHVTVSAQATEEKVTVLETKSAKLDYPSTIYSVCVIRVELALREWSVCASEKETDCFTLAGTELRAPRQYFSLFVENESWIKVSD